MILALLIAAAMPCRCRCPKPIDWAEVDRALEGAARKTDRALALDKERRELDAIVRRNRERFERGER